MTEEMTEEMTENQRLKAYEKMRESVHKEYESVVSQMERLKAEGKIKSVTYRQLMGRKTVYGNMLALYRLYELEE